MTLTAAFNHLTFDFFRPKMIFDATAKKSEIDYEAHSPYAILGVRRNATDTDIKRAWRKLMMANHPDLGGDINKTLAINAAYKEICKRRGI